MKKLIILILSLIILSCNKESAPSNLISLKLTEFKSYGPFPQMFSALDWTPLSEKGIWANTEIKTTGVPQTWTYSNVAQVWFDSHQFAYQNYILGNLSEKTFNNLKKSWKIDLEKRKLSNKPIDCFVHVAIGANKDGQLEYIIDTNNDKDFSDEQIKKPEQMRKGIDLNKVIEESQSIVAEISTNSGIQKKEIKFLILADGQGNLIYNFPQIARTNFLENEILVSNGFSNIPYDDISQIAINKENPEVVGLNEIILIKNSFYKNLGVDINKNELHLLKLPKDTIIYASNVGFNAKPFNVKQLESNDSLKLEDFNNKLLYLEFWGTWCAPCIDEIPNLKIAYDASDRNAIEFLGVAVFDKKEKLKNAIEKYGLNWPQVLDTDANQFKESYNVTSYPTSFLIDPNGKILAKNIRGKKLLDTLNYYSELTK